MDNKDKRLKSNQPGGGKMRKIGNSGNLRQAHFIRDDSATCGDGFPYTYYSLSGQLLDTVYGVVSSIGIRRHTSGRGFTVCAGETDVKGDFATFTSKMSKYPLVETHEEVLNYFGYTLTTKHISLMTLRLY
jgi:hypothetical protein